MFHAKKLLLFTARRPEQNFNKKRNVAANSVTNHTSSIKSEENDLDTSGFASETTEREVRTYVILSEDDFLLFSHCSKKVLKIIRLQLQML